MNFNQNNPKFNKEKQNSSKEDQIYGVFGEQNQRTRFRKRNTKKTKEKLIVPTLEQTFIKEKQLENNQNEDNGKKSKQTRKKPKELQVKTNEQEEELENDVNWQKYSSGFGLKFLEKFGYIQGQNLGPQQSEQPTQSQNNLENKQLEEIKRTKTHSFDSKKNTRKHKQPKHHMFESLQLWKKESQTNPHFRTFKDVIEEAQRFDRQHENTTSYQGYSNDNNFGNGNFESGKNFENKRTFYKWSQQSYQEENNMEADEDGFSLKELRFNIGIILELTEKQIQKVYDKTNFFSHQQKKMNEDFRFLDKKKQAIQKQINEAQAVLEIISKCKSIISDENGFYSDLLVENFAKMQKQYFSTYYTFNLALLFIPLVFPFIRRECADWDPVSQPTKPLRAIERWKSILQNQNVTIEELLLQNVLENMEPEMKKKLEKSNDGKNNTKSLVGLINQADKTKLKKAFIVGDSVYEKMHQEIFIPKISRTIKEEFEAKNINNVLKLLEIWIPLFSLEQKAQFVEQSVVPPLKEIIERWNPSSVSLDNLMNEEKNQEAKPTFFLDHIVGPFFVYIKDQLEIFLPLIRTKLSKQFIFLFEKATNHAEDSQIISSVLEPWITFLDQHNIGKIIYQSVIPSIQTLLEKRLTINPSNQEIEPFLRVLEYQKIISEQVNLDKFCRILAEYFFPKWNKTLCLWMSTNKEKINYDEIQKWFKGWKSLFSPEMLANQHISASFNLSLQMMNLSLTNSENIHEYYSQEQKRILSKVNQRKENLNQNPNQNQEINKNIITKPIDMDDLSFKEVVQLMAEENSIPFIPTNKKYKDNQVYFFGRFLIYFRNDLIFAKNSDDKEWFSTNIDFLIKQELEKKQ
ncbi:tuftelin-interacting protein [Anaeramoeba ignava]|uniref:Tuftelin-interacting protein n=1 Tax=Anaeramoeba ignava TaxID=1746090 RepID=A0A9Q0LKY9_ANAIG|nr:tuftelin-interacting protein [Anaeramoeba ignava]